MNIASLMNPPKPRTPAPAPGRLELARLQATVLLQGTVSAVKDSAQAFRHMRDVLTGGYAQSRP